LPSYPADAALWDSVARMRAIRRFTVRPALPDGLRLVEDLVTNLRWSWHPQTQNLFQTMDAKTWAASDHNPVRFIGSLPASRLRDLAADEEFTARLRLARADLEEYLTGDRWYQTLGDDVPRQIAYFSPEFGITAVLPQYSGGLGILAGDHLKAASDLGVPILGVGLLYRHGYFRQSLSAEAWQQEWYPVIDPDELPLTLLREADGSPARISLSLPGGHALLAAIWLAHVGRVPLLLMDSDIEENSPVLREVTDRLYGGGSDHRLLQELLLGVGGVRALRVYCRITGAPDPEVYHSNEGHAGFLGVERIREFMAADGLAFDAALEKARAATVFTTHTPVPAGIDRFSRDVVRTQFSVNGSDHRMSVDDVLALGAEDYEGGDPTVFNMAVMGLRLAARANGVSKLHGEVSRDMFKGLWPGFDAADVPITSVTNGVHAPTWVAKEVFDLAERESILSSVQSSRDWAVVDKVPGRAIWATKRELRGTLVDSVRRRVRASQLNRGAAATELGWVESVLDPDVLTIGFARRVPSYKRLTLMLHDRERLTRLLLHPERPIQIVIAGKAHPADDGGKRLIQEIVKFADNPRVRHRIVFLPNYDIAMAQPLYPGCDVWLNNPLRPYEACGTSGMKAALNGGLNLSILDGWWDEWYDGENGWAITSADGVEDTDRRDELEANALYDLIEHEVTPRFYDRDADGLPPRWIEMMRHTIKSLGPKVLASRMVRDYVVELYTPTAQGFRRLNAEPNAASELARWKAAVRQAWAQVLIEHVESSGIPDTPSQGASFTVRVFVTLGSLSPDDVDVQVVHGRVSGDDQIRDPQVVTLPHAEVDDGIHRYEGEIDLETTGQFGYTVRVLPRHELLVNPAEVGVIALPVDVNTVDME
jgi:glycogen phosphorylase